ncbi:MAG: response regulator [Oscillospiraceae bacterium]|jgi:two-component system response regulator YesN|nr:response regulator [Oscillospiraceae bacterium]
MANDPSADTSASKNLLKVFLVDDEIVIREGIRNRFPWEETGFTLCGEAPDGEIALSMIQDLRPDILVTDIRMPFMDGMALSRAAAAAMPWMRIVILSGYDDFAYAREAITLGVKEYLLKPVSVQQLRETLERLAGVIAAERSQRADLDALRRQLASSQRLVQERLVSRVFDGTFTGAMMAEARAALLPLNAACYAAMVLEPERRERLLELRAAAQRVADVSGGAVALAESGGQLLALVLGDSAADAEDRAYSYAQAVAHGSERVSARPPLIAIGSIVSSLADVPRSAGSARAVLKGMSADGSAPARILGASDVDSLGLVSRDLMKSEVTPLYDALRFASARDVPRVVERYFASFGGMASQSLLVAHYALVDILLASARVVKASGGEPSKVLPASLVDALSYKNALGAARPVQSEGGIPQMGSAPSEIIETARDLLTSALAYRDERAGSTQDAVIRKARAYIEANYHKPEITLNEVARHAGLSANHFCTVFSQNMGTTFLEYLTSLRMDKAKAFLRESDLRSADIAERIGYTDARYFRYLFKRYAGMPPREYREGVRNGAGK